MPVNVVVAAEASSAVAAVVVVAEGEASVLPTLGLIVVMAMTMTTAQYLA